MTDFIQGGAGTSTNMNANEVMANLALESLGHKRGEYQHAATWRRCASCWRSSSPRPEEVKRIAEVRQLLRSVNPGLPR